MNLYKPLAYIHALLAIVSILCGLIAIIAQPKGNLIHKKAGQVYFYSYLVACIIGLIMLTIKFKSILLGLTVLNLYVVINGFLSFRGFLRQKKMQILMLIILLWDITFLSFYSTIQDNLTWRLVFYFYIVLMTYVLMVDSYRLINPHKKIVPTIILHMEKMLLSYLALIGGLLIQLMNPFVDESYRWTMWIMAYVIGIPLIIFWIFKRQKERLV